MAKGGINSWQWNKMYGDRPALEDAQFKTVIISLGSNDHKGVHTKEELEKIRDKVHGHRVFWILPHGNMNAPQNPPIEEIQAIVQSIAQRHGDTVIPIRSVSPDKIHPTGRGYKEIAEQTQ
jgi:lysophospholipase L1-like esterase